MPRYVEVAHSDGVVSLTVHREPSLSWNLETMTELVDEVVRANADAESRVILISASGDAFCLGGEIGRPDDGDNVDIHRQRYVDAFVRFSSVMRHSRLPTIARVHGVANAGGLAVVAACDIAIGSENAFIGTPEITGGAFPLLAMGILHEYLSPKSAFELFYGGLPVSPERAREIGVFTEVVNGSELEGRISYWCRLLASRDARTVAIGRRTYWAMMGVGPAERMEIGGRALVELLAPNDGTPDQSYMASAFVRAKRSADAGSAGG